MVEGNLNYYKASYRRVYDNFLFSSKLYVSDLVMLQRICQSSLYRLKKLYKQFLKQDEVVTYHLMLSYKRSIEAFYQELKERD
ncbi:hypothetical protein [Streptococcus mutans]|uniref:hypothetical protein n=1 Tax=Streptococcus mutans TaxID=1309 RepID=UPI0002B54281|nr:hypothetical protein [Streptococcus mutans]EMC16349.1 hypothetical protein SMU78_08717 [Streptococcus mutans W6]EMC21398.1 hypothetical protein SMU81_08315 [Streptococcus mutans SF14]EMC42323.1 hypothetical protein SMU98_08018 [Streptococcus mutans SM1]OVE99746.1 hypothetical protein CAV53_08920 [Streptococcus mutans]PNL99925.1 hypothetical protein A6J86_000155 [Streptococcus mutans]